jgi:hypothetical protein
LEGRRGYPRMASAKCLSASGLSMSEIQGK